MARNERKSVAAVIREAVDAHTARTPDARAVAIQRLLAIGAPIDDWEVMKREIARGPVGDR